MSRTTRKTLETLVATLNTVLDRPAEPWTDGKANLGNLHLDSMNPGDGRTYALECIGNERGGVSRPFHPGRLKAGAMELYLRGVLAGIGAAKK